MSNSPRGQKPRDPREDDEIERLKPRRDVLKVQARALEHDAPAMFLDLRVCKVASQLFQRGESAFLIRSHQP